MTHGTNNILALDAMGVIYAEADDGLNLLYPFIVERGGCSDIPEIIRLYNSASLGKMSAAEFWRSAGIDPLLEDEYLSRHRLSDGLIEFLETMHSRGAELWCLSNDIAEWSGKLRERFGLNRYFRGFVISGDAGARKPDPAIYHQLLEQAACRPCDVVFVDDRLRNIKAADALGIRTVLFNPASQEMHGHQHTVVRTFAELQDLLSSSDFLHP